MTISNSTMPRAYFGGDGASEEIDSFDAKCWIVLCTHCVYIFAVSFAQEDFRLRGCEGLKRRMEL